MKKQCGKTLREKMILQVKSLLLAQQAERMFSHYKETENERELWQAGDFIDEYL